METTKTQKRRRQQQEELGNVSRITSNSFIYNTNDSSNSQSDDANNNKKKSICSSRSNNNNNTSTNKQDRSISKNGFYHFKRFCCLTFLFLATQQIVVLSGILVEAFSFSNSFQYSSTLTSTSTWTFSSYFLEKTTTRRKISQSIPSYSSLSLYPHYHGFQYVHFQPYYCSSAFGGGGRGGGSNNGVSRYCHHYKKSSTLLMMAKGDGKKKRKKQSDIAASSPAPAPAPAPQPAAPRVSTDINIPIRSQIRYGRLNKQFRESGGTAFRQTKKVTRTSYRRTWDEEEIEQKAEERRRKGQDPDWDVILNRTKADPLVIVDGYNIIHKWARLKKHMIKGDALRARQLLLDDLENLKSIKGWRIEVVYDGARRNARKGPLGDTRQQITHADRAENKQVSKFGVREVFTGSGVEADSYIEAKCASAKNVTNGAYTGMFIVATDDAMIRLAGQNAGALCMSADRFVDELKAVKKTVEYRVEAAMAKANGVAMRPEKMWGTDVFFPPPAAAGMGPSLPPSSSSSNVNKKKNGVELNQHNDTETSSSKNDDHNKDSQTEELPPLPLIGTNYHVAEDGQIIFTGRYGRSKVLIVDKRKKKPRGGSGGNRGNNSTDNTIG